MNMLHLQYFYMVAREGGYTNASKALRIQQPAISRMVRQLELSIGFPLFEKIGRNVRLTARGKQVYEQSKVIFAEVDNLKVAVGELKETVRGPLAIGAAEPIASHFIPAVLQGVLADFPGLYPVVFSGPASMLFERISKGELEFGLFFHIPPLPENLKLTVIRKIRFHLVIRRDLRKKAPVLESFIGSREIDDVSTRSFPTLEKLKKLHPKASIKISSNNLTAHRSLVLRGLGVAILPDFLISEDLANGSLSDVLPKEKLEFELKLIQRNTSVPNLNGRTFLEYCSKI
ncbi:MAG: LysR family transcriptional regulator [Bdellovibrio sp.]